MSDPKVCGECGERYWNAGAHAERCRGPRPTPLGVRLRQPAYPAWDWAGMIADEADADQRVASYLGGQRRDEVKS